MSENVELYKRRLAREVSARKQTEAVIEKKSLELYQLNLERQQAEAALRESEERYRLLVELSPDAILVETERQIIFANKAALQLFRAGSLQELLGRSMISFVAPDDRHKAVRLAKQLTGFGDHVGEEGKLKRLDGKLIDAAVTCSLFAYREKPAYQLVARDISERKRLENQLHYQATHDVLTGLPNRTLLMDRLKQSIAYAKRYNHQFVVAFIDLDRFKFINDTFGHDVGDQLLVMSAQRMQSCIRATDTLARLSGDEFVLLLQGTDNTKVAMLLLERIVGSLSQPLTINGHTLTVTCSVGCSTYPLDGKMGDALLKFADTAMYHAKENGRNSLRIYTEQLRRHADEKILLEQDLRQALGRGEFQLHYQPQICLRTGSILGAEALLRWHCPGRGIVPPSDFIPVAENIGLITPIGEWILHTACAQIRVWQQNKNIHHPRVAVNLSAKQITRPGLDALIRQCLEDSGIAPALLEVELTESASMDDPDITISFMNKVRDLGISISIDDFGTGYSNLKYLMRFPVNTLKIDGSFIRKMSSDPKSLAIVDSIIIMAHRLGLKVIGEQAETRAQVSLLWEHGCDQVQGYYFSPPLPAPEFAALLAAGPMPLDFIPAVVAEQQVLLLVDDDPYVISAIRRQLRAENYRVVAATSADEALELLACQKVDAILTDYRLPGTDGVELLSRVKHMYPDIIRLMISGQADFETACKAINQGAIQRFIAKPWGRDLLLQTLDDVFTGRLTGDRPDRRVQ